MSQLSLLGEMTPLHAFPKKIQGEAEFSLDLKYRYRLERRWARERGTALWVLLNPSTAGAEDTDRTVEQLIHFTWRENLGRMLVVNLFAMISTIPKALSSMSEPEPVGARTDLFIIDAVAEATRIFVAWGSFDMSARANVRVRGRDKAVLELLEGHDLWCLGKTKDGSPRHPCRLGHATPMERYS